MPKFNCEYTIELASNCPNDNDLIIYKVTICSNKIIMVEDLLAFAKECKSFPMFQEDLTETLSSRFESDVFSVGVHQGIEIKCTVGAE